MSYESGTIATLARFRDSLEKKIERLDSEIKDLKATLEALNLILLEKGFKNAALKEKESANKRELQRREEVVDKKTRLTFRPTIENENVVPLKTNNDEPLAIIYTTENSIHVLPDESKNFKVDTPPFNSFLVERVLVKMQEKDAELVRMGQLTPDKIFDYAIIREGELIREIVLQNVDDVRLRELKSSIRWTLEKMYEKTKS